MTRALAGPSMVCKAIRKRFDSLPRLHIFVERPRAGIRMPQDYGKADLFKLMLFHHKKHVEAATKVMELRERLIASQKELSSIKYKFTEVRGFIETNDPVPCEIVAGDGGYWVKTPYSQIGPYESVGEAKRVLADAGFRGVDAWVDTGQGGPKT